MGNKIGVADKKINVVPIIEDIPLDEDTIYKNKMFDIVPTNKPIIGYSPVHCLKDNDGKQLYNKMFLARVEIPIGANVIRVKKPLYDDSSDIHEYNTNKLIITDIINHQPFYQQCRLNHFPENDLNNKYFNYRKGATYSKTLLCKNPTEVYSHGFDFMLEKNIWDAQVHYIAWYNSVLSW